MKKITNNIFVLTVLLVFLVTCRGGDKVGESRKTYAEVLQEVNSVHAVGKVSPVEDWAIISATVPARIQRLMIEEGDTVSAGQVLLWLEHTAADLDVQYAQARLHSLQAERRMIMEDLQKAQISAEEWKKKYETSQKLLLQKAETREQVQADYSAWQQQELTVKGLEQKVKAQQYMEEEQRVQIRASENQLTDFRVTAPTDGIVVELSAKVGQNVGSADELGKIVKTGNPIVEAEVDELFANDVRVGQQVYVSVSGRTDTLAQGAVSYVSPVLSNKSILYEIANEGADRRVRKIKIHLEGGHSLAINAKVDCQIKIR